MRLRPSVLAMMARGGLVGLVSLSTGCPDPSARPAPAPVQPGTPAPRPAGVVASPSPAATAQSPSPVAPTAPSDPSDPTAPSDPGQTPVEPELLEPGTAPLPDSDSPQAAATGTPVATPSVATPACGGQHTDMNFCSECGYCPPCGQG